MNSTYIIYNAHIVNEGREFTGAVYIRKGFIEEVFEGPIPSSFLQSHESLDAHGKLLIPGVIDDQVHFREPGLTHKGEIYTEARAAVAGGVTSFMDMPNTQPQTITLDALEDKFRRAAERSLSNHSFYMGATTENIGQLRAADPHHVCGIKVFLGASTGNMLVDQPDALRKIFAIPQRLIAIHSEDEQTIRANLAVYKEKYGEHIPMEFHPAIRSAEACYKSTVRAVKLAEELDTRLHVIHISTADELPLFRNDVPLEKKQITTEVCVHHLWFDDRDYARLGALIKWNPAIKSVHDREALFEGLLNGTLDIIATDHAPHTLEEKKRPYTSCPSGAPLVQHSLVAMLEFWHREKISLPAIVEKMCHAPARCFRIDRRGYLRKGYHADLVLVDTRSNWTVNPGNILYKCGWSPLEGVTFTSKVTHTFVNGHLAYEEGTFHEEVKGSALVFNP